MTASTTSAVLVGRQTELSQLREALKRARADEPLAVLVGGEAGVGKTRLVEEFGRQAAGEGVRVLTGQCLELGEEGLSFAPFAAVLRMLLRRDGVAVFAGYERELARLVPELADGPGPPGGRGQVGRGQVGREQVGREQAGSEQAGPEPVGRGQVWPEQTAPHQVDRERGHGAGPLPARPGGVETSLDPNRGHLFDLMAALFERLATEQPLLLVIEDLHWADRSTRDLVRFLVRSARASRALLVGTYRSDELHRGHPLRPFLAELDRVRAVERLELDRLDRDGTAQILAHLLGREPAPSLVDDIHSRAEGNPFFIEELASCADRASAGLPDTVRDLLLTRVDLLSEPAQRVLRIAAAGGQRIGHRLLTEVAGLPEVELEEALRAAVAVQLVVPDPDGTGYEFRHALVREAVHDDLLPGEHARLHARYAAAIEARPELVGGERAPAEVAHHWYAAHDHPRALTAALRAAIEAGHRYAYAEESRLLDRVLALWEQVPDAAGRTGMDHPAVLAAALNAAIGAGDLARALSLTRAQLAEIDRDAQPLLAARLLVTHAKLLTQLGKSDGAAALHEAYELADRVPDGVPRALLLGEIALRLTLVGQAVGARIAEQAAALAHQLGDPVAELSATITVARTCFRLIPAEAALNELRRAAGLAVDAGDTASLLRLLVNISDVLHELGDYAGSMAAAQQGIADARRLGVGRTTGVMLLGNLAEALVALGRFDEAEVACAEAARLDPPGVLVLSWLQQRAQVRLARGHPGAAETVSRAAGLLSRPYLRPYNRVSLQELRITAALCADDPVTAAAAATAALAEPRLLEKPRYAWPMLGAAARAAVTQAAVTAADPRLPAQVAEAAAALTAQYPEQRAYAAQVTAELLALADPPSMRRPNDGRPPAGQPSDLAGPALDQDPEAPVEDRAAPDEDPAAVVEGSAAATGDAAPAADGDPVRRAGEVYAAWQAAVAAWRVDGQPYQLACALVRLAEAAAGAGDRPAAAEAVAEAGTLAARLGVPPLAGTVAVLARRLGLRGAGAPSATAAAPPAGGTEPLTARELEVLRLVSAGHSNRRIATELFISPKTASVHVSRIIAKLKVANRGEAAAVAHRLGLLARPAPADRRAD